MAFTLPRTILLFAENCFPLLADNPSSSRYQSISGMDQSSTDVMSVRSLLCKAGKDTVFWRPASLSVMTSSADKMDEREREKGNTSLEQAMLMERDAALSEAQPGSIDTSSSEEIDMEEESASPPGESISLGQVVIVKRALLNGDEGLTDAIAKECTRILNSPRFSEVRKKLRILFYRLRTGCDWGDIVKPDFENTGEAVRKRLVIWRKLVNWKDLLPYLKSQGIGANWVMSFPEYIEPQ